MPVCPNCKYEYVNGIKKCPDCGVDLVDKLPPEIILKEADWIVVYTTSFDYEAEMLKGNLESAGISVTILSQKDSNFPTPGDLSIIRLLVKKEDADSAVAFLNEFKKNLESENEDDETE
uniref:DUF2007 domain-containing protein n=1 Tax=Ignavibacterium album TaxID=591197 RepID=A0A7V2ZLS6_9BACT